MQSTRVKSIPAIVLDSDQRSSLAVTRSLGRHGIPVINGAEKIPSLASSSRYSIGAFSYPSPEQEPDAFIETLIRKISQFEGSVLIPTTDISVAEVLAHRKDFPEQVQIPFVEYNQYKKASNKINLFRLAQQLKLPTPQTLFSEDFTSSSEIIQAAGELGFPLVIKPGNSRIRTAEKWIRTNVQYARSSDELMIFLKSKFAQQYPFMLQKKISGPGCGIFLLMWNGEVKARFSHRRIREKPPSGGVSVVCESVPAPETAVHAAIELLHAMNWKGVAMVEFKVDSRDQSLRLMEINARFWGSLQLAISAGVDFPFVLYQLAIEKSVITINGYVKYLRIRWELGDLDHLLIRMKHSHVDLNLPPHAPSKGTVFLNFMTDFFRPKLKHEVFKFDDPRPFFQEVSQYLKKF